MRMIFLSPIYFLLPRKKAFFIPKDWARSSVWLMEKIVGTTFEIEGLENIPKGSYIFAPKHLTPYLRDLPLLLISRRGLAPMSLQGAR